MAKPLKGGAKGVQFETVPENQEPGTSESVEHNKTLIKVRPGSSTREALSEVTDNKEVVKTEIKTMLSKGKCSAETCQSFVRGNISSTPEFISIIQAVDIKTILK